MFCRNCGKQVDDNSTFCPACGKNLCTSDTAKSGQLHGKARSILIEDTEEIKAVLGRTYMQTYLAAGILGNGFAVLTNKRAYFKGKCYRRSGRKLTSVIEEKVVDLKDISGSGYMHRSATWAKVLAILFVVVASVFLMIGIANGSEDRLEYIIISVVFGLLPALIFAQVYKIRSCSVFEVSYAGGGIGFSLHWIGKQETDSFQRQLVLLKQEANK